MLERAELEFLKDQHPDYRIICFTFGKAKQQFVFKSLTIDEFKAITNIASDSDQFDELVCQVTLLFPEEYDFSDTGVAGIPTTFAKDIIEVSGVGNPNVIVNTFRAYESLMDSTRETFMAMIKAAMPEIRWEEMEDWGWNKLLKYAAASKKTLEIKAMSRNDLSDFEIKEISPEELNQKQLEDAAERGLDPILEFGHTLKFKSDTLPSPFLGGSHWRNGDVVELLRGQIYERIGKNPSFL